MNNLHVPQRLDGESFADYKVRRAESKQALRLMTAHRHNGGVNSRKQYRAEMCKSGSMGKRIRAYKALMAAWAAKRIVKWKGLRDEHGAYTVVGKDHYRMWLAGISAQRGY